MLEKLKISNFQSHKYSELNFHSGVNIIVGTSDSGKSAIIRALRVLIYNQPTGDAYRSHWGGDTILELSDSDKNLIKRLKTTSKNQYWLNDLKFEAFGASVPDKIRQLLNMGEVNFQSQADQWFLIDNTPGEIAQFFNRTAHLEKIDIGRKNIEKWTRHISNDLDSAKKILKENNQKYSSYSYLNKMEQEVEVLEEMETDLSNKTRCSSDLQSLINNVNEVEGEIKTNSEILSLEGILYPVLDKTDKKQALSKEFDGLSSLLDNIEICDEDTYYYQSIMDLKQAVDSIFQSYNKIDESKKEKRELDKLIENTSQTTKDLSKWQKKLNDLHDKFHEAIGDSCPLCGQTIEK